MVVVDGDGGGGGGDGDGDSETVVLLPLLLLLLLLMLSLLLLFRPGFVSVKKQLCELTVKINGRRGDRRGYVEDMELCE
jgi:hypothetical protein